MGPDGTVTELQAEFDADYQGKKPPKVRSKTPIESAVPIHTAAVGHNPVSPEASRYSSS